MALIKQLYWVTTWHEFFEIAKREYGFQPSETYRQTVSSRPSVTVVDSVRDFSEQARQWELLTVAPTQSQIEYTTARGILIAALRDTLRFKGNRLALAIRSADTGSIVGIQTRESRICDKGERYKIIPWGTQHGYFYDFPPDMGADGATPRKILIVEGFMDYLSVRQLTPYVIGIPSVSSNCHDFSQFSRFDCTFIMAPHRDIPGEWLFEKLNQKLPVERIKLDEHDNVHGDDINDINDYLVKHGRTEFENFLRWIWVLLEL